MVVTGIRVCYVIISKVGLLHNSKWPALLTSHISYNGQERGNKNNWLPSCSRGLLPQDVNIVIIEGNQWGALTTFPQCIYSLEFREILSENHIRDHCVSVSGISKIMHCGILINMPCLIIGRYFDGRWNSNLECSTRCWCRCWLWETWNQNKICIER